MRTGSVIPSQKVASILDQNTVRLKMPNSVKTNLAESTTHLVNRRGKSNE